MGWTTRSPVLYDDPMQNVVSISAVAAASLLAAQAALVLARTPLCARRSVPLLLAAFLILLSLHVLLPRGSAIHDLVLIALLWAAGSFLIRALNRRLFGSWAGANISLVCTLVISRALGQGTPPPTRHFVPSGSRSSQHFHSESCSKSGGRSAPCQPSQSSWPALCVCALRESKEWGASWPSAGGCLPRRPSFSFRFVRDGSSFRKGTLRERLGAGACPGLRGRNG